MLNLETVTVCGVDTRTPELGLLALRHCLRGIRFGGALLFAPPAPELNAQAAALGVTLIDPGPIRSIEEYSAFMLRGMAAHIATEHCLVTQWDGFVIDPSAWSDEFLQYDYIGALWRDRPGDLAVGNGGFSLRSRRLLQALLDPAIHPVNPEDLCICELNRSYLQRRHGIRFAPASVAARFSYEHVRSSGPTFGFHGILNVADALHGEEMLDLARRMTVDMALGGGARTLARRLVYSGQYQAAGEILRRRVAGGDRRWRTLSLYPRMWLRRALGLDAGREARAGR